MERIREARRGGGGAAAVAVNGGGPPPQPPPRRRPRSGGGGGPRDSPRSERRRGERLLLNGCGGGRDDVDESSDESLGDDDDDDDADEGMPSRIPPTSMQQRRSPSTSAPSPPQQGGSHGHHIHHYSSSAGGGGGGGYHNHQQQQQQQQQMQRKAGSNPRSPVIWKAADEMIGVPVPRKARSASTKRSSHEWLAPSGGGGSGTDLSQIQRPASSRPISPSPAAHVAASPSAPVRKKLKPIGGAAAGAGTGTSNVAKQRPMPSTPPTPPAKIAKSSSFIQEEIEVAEFLFGLRQFQGAPEKDAAASEPKSGGASPSALVLRASDSASNPSSLATVAPKRKRPRLVKCDDDSRPASPAKADAAEPSARLDALPPPPPPGSEAKQEPGAATENGGAAAQPLDSRREPEKRDDNPSKDSEPSTGELDRQDRPEIREEQPLFQPPPAPQILAPKEAPPVDASEANHGDATATKIELASDGSAREGKYSIDLMAPPPGKLSPDRDGASDPDADNKGLDSQIEMVPRANSEKKEGRKAARAVEIDLEERKPQKVLADEHTPKKLTLQLDLEKPGIGDDKAKPEQQPLKVPKAEIKQEKAVPSSVAPPMPMAVGGWPGGFPPFGYLGQAAPLSAAAIHQMDTKPGSSNSFPPPPLLPPPPVRPKRCATHCYIAQQIQYHQRLAKMNSLNSFWAPPTAAAASTVAGTAPFFGPKPFHMGVVPPAEAASLLGSSMQGNYPGRNHASLQESKGPTLAASPLLGNLGKDKAALGNNGVAESSQKKQHTIQETPHSAPVANMLHGPAIIFPFNQQQAAAAAAAAVAAVNRAGESKSAGAGNSMPLSGAAHSSAPSSGTTTMNLSFASLPPADAQFLAILQNGAYPFPVPAHTGGPPTYRGPAPGQAMPFFNGQVYSSQMLHPSEQQVVHQQALKKNAMSSSSASSQKHLQQHSQQQQQQQQQQQTQGILGYAPNAAAAAAAAAVAANPHGFPSGNQRPVLLPGLAQRQDSDKSLQDGPSTTDNRVSHGLKSIYDHNYPVPVHHLQNFALMPAAAVAGSQNEKKSADHHHHQQHPGTTSNRGQTMRLDLSSSQPFAMPFGSFGGPGAAPTGLDFSSLAQNPALFQSHQEAGRHGYPQFSFAAAPSVQAQHKAAQQQIGGDMKSVAAESTTTSSTGDNERKKLAASKFPGGDSQQHSLSFSKADNKPYVSAFLGGGINESSSRTLSLIPDSTNGFGMTSKSTSGTMTTVTSAAASTTTNFTHHQQQQQLIQLRQQQQLQVQHQIASSRPRSAAPSSNTGGYSDRLSLAPNLNSNLANFSHALMSYPPNVVQGSSVPGQTPQLKASSTVRATAAPAAATPQSSNLIVMKNSSLHQQQGKAPPQALSTPSHQTQISFSMNSSKTPPSVANISGGAADLSRSSTPTMASGSPSNSVSKSTGGSPPTSGSVKPVPPAVTVTLTQPQQPASKNSASTSSSKSSSVNHYNMPSILGQPNMSSAPNLSNKTQPPPQVSMLKHQPFPQGHFFFSNAYTQAPGAGYQQKRLSDKPQQQLPHQQSTLPGSAAMLSLCPTTMSMPAAGGPADPAKALAVAAASGNMKMLHPPPGLLHATHFAAATQSASGAPHPHLPASFSFVSMPPMSVKPATDQKPTAGSDNLRACSQLEKR